MGRAARARRWGGALVMAGALVVATPACASSSSDDGASAVASSDDAVALLEQALEATSEVESGRFAISAHVTGEVDGDAVDAEVEAEGAFSEEAEAFELSTDLAPIFQAAADAGDEVPSSIPVHVIAVEPDVYVKLDAHTSELGLPEGWIRLDSTEGLEDDLGASGFTDGFGDGFPEKLDDDLLSGDPDDVLETLRTEGLEVRNEGRDEIDGTSVTVLVGELDPEAAAAAAPDEEAAETERAIEESGVEPVPFKVYVDDDGLIRRVELTVTQSNSESSIRARIVLELFDLGDAVEIAPPPAGEVLDLSKLDLTPFLFGGMETS